MLSKKDIIKKFRPIFWAEPEKFYPTAILDKEGFHRNTCSKCKKPFWNTDKKRTICGDPACAPEESFAFINKTPAKHKLSYIEVWQKFSKMFEGFGYTPINRYPVVARWNPTTDYTMASISAFQPYVISGAVQPPANPLTIPQFCLRFSDIDNVGITMSHHTGFVMIGQHMFVPPKDWDQNKAFEHIHLWMTQGLGIPNNELTYIEDAWAGGGNLGCCMEIFSRGCELANQVYMLYEVDENGKEKELSLKVLDMGLGMERNAWFSQGCPTIYDAVFPDVLKKLFHVTGYVPDEDLLRRFVPYAGLLNIDEVEDIDKAWNTVSKKIGIASTELREKIEPLSGIYSIAEHTRSLLFAINDAALPSNVGGGYNLRILARRALSFIDRYGWNVYLPDVCRWHAEELKPIFPELSKNLDDIQKILDVEISKFESTKQKAKQIVDKLVESEEKIDVSKLIELYDSNGISPNMIKDVAKLAGKEIHVPDNFYALVAERHEQQTQSQHVKKKELDLGDVAATDALYFKDWRKKEFEAEVLKIIDKNVVLDATYFYPTSGGQAFDTGTMNKIKVVNIIKQGPHIVHILEKEPGFKEGDVVNCVIDWDRRFQLAQHHTGTHVVNAAAKKILGHHVNQAGAKKTVDKAHLDITHYESLDQQTQDKIEKEANKIIEKKIAIEKSFMPRTEAEQKYGMQIYQGGAIPGQLLRIVNIPQVDVECCGGTHLDNTSEIAKIKIIKSTKIQDGVVRLTFVAGKAADDTEQQEENIVDKAAEILDCIPEQVPARAAELFANWKKARKSKDSADGSLLVLKSAEKSKGDLLGQTATVLKTQPEHILKTLNRFKTEIESWVR